MDCSDEKNQKNEMEKLIISKTLEKNLKKDSPTPKNLSTITLQIK